MLYSPIKQHLRLLSSSFTVSTSTHVHKSRTYLKNNFGFIKGNHLNWQCFLGFHWNFSFTATAILQEDQNATPTTRPCSSHTGPRKPEMRGSTQAIQPANHPKNIINDRKAPLKTHRLKQDKRSSQWGTVGLTKAGTHFLLCSPCPRGHRGSYRRLRPIERARKGSLMIIRN